MAVTVKLKIFFFKFNFAKAINLEGTAVSSYRAMLTTNNRTENATTSINRTSLHMSM